MYPTSEETALWVYLNLAQRSIYRSMDSALKAEGLPPLRWYDVLWSLERAKDCGLRPFELEKSLLFEQSNLSRLLRRIVDEGLAKEKVFEHDRRGKVLTITARGRRVRKSMWKIYGPLMSSHMASVDKTKQLAEVTQTLKSLIEKDGVIDVDDFPV